MGESRGGEKINVHVQHAELVARGAVRDGEAAGPLRLPNREDVAPAAAPARAHARE